MSCRSVDVGWENKQLRGEGHGALVLKVDIDTHDGMRHGVPVLLEILSRHGIHATFCLSFGPDNAGKAIYRLFRDPAFFKKMLRTGAPGLYGWRTVLSGTLLPARPIARAFPDLVRQIASEGHEVIVHAWDHRRWQDHLHHMTREEIKGEFDKSFSSFEDILGRRPLAVAAPGWQATANSLAVQDQLDLLYASDLREGPPCFLQCKGHGYRTLQIPTTGPCLEELLTVGIRNEAGLAQELLDSLRETAQPVLAVHAEVEGGPYRTFFDRLVPSLLKNHKEILCLEDVARRILSIPDSIPRRRLTRISLPGRAGTAASST
jgi:undecaprenyl phosphate-alpha-L-ara4FN deformylase